MARYLKSLNTGVVLPYVEAALLSPGVREMTAEECAEYDASLGKKSSTAPAAKKKVRKKKQAAKTGVATQDISEGEPSAEEVLKALEDD
jgi:hypothetical protein